MAQNITNTVLTQIAIKRLSGKALTNAKYSLPEEPLGSSVQSLSTTVFGQNIPNSPSTGSSLTLGNDKLFVIQSASATDPGTIQLVEFDVVPIAHSDYENVVDADAYTSETGYAFDTGQVDGYSTYHAYVLKLTGSYQAGSTAAGFDTYASTPKSIGSSPFVDGFATTGSLQLQIVPEFASTNTGIGSSPQNPYTPLLSNTNTPNDFTLANRISATSGIDWYLDAYSGILFIQDPAAYGTEGSPNSGDTIPAKLRAFIYVGKYQNEITTTEHELYFSGSVGGFTLATAQTASFVSEIGLTISASEENATLTFGQAGETLAVTSSWAISASVAVDTTNALNLRVHDVENSAGYHSILFISASNVTAATYNNNNVKVGADSTQFRYYPGVDGGAGPKLTLGSSTQGIEFETGSIDTQAVLAGPFNLLNSNIREINFGQGADIFNIGNANGTSITNYSGSYNFRLGTLIENVPTGSINITGIATGSDDDRTPLVITSTGNVLKANADFADNIVGAGGAITSASSDTQGQILLYTGSSTVAYHTVDIIDLKTDGNPTFNNVVVTGNLTVEGTRTELQVSQLQVEDQFILLASQSSDSAVAKDSGIIVQTDYFAGGGTPRGAGLYYDADANTWLFTSASYLASNTTSFTTNITATQNKSSNLVGVQVEAAANPSHTPYQLSDTYRYGQMYVDSTDTINGGLYIYLPS